jgi:YD repeat-containing protein
VTDLDGSKVTYDYRSDPANPDTHYWTKITEISPKGEQSSHEEEFNIGTDASGVEHLAGFKSKGGESLKEVEMDERGRVKRINRPNGGFSEYTYHPTLNKISSVLTEDGKTDFEYNTAGNLVLATNTQGQKITLEYDKSKHISRMIETGSQDNHRRELTFKYNKNGKPIIIKMVGKGTIKVEYDEQGEISKVESKQGAKMSMEVTAAFRTLLKVVKVAEGDF